MNLQNSLWVEKYRPKTTDEYVFVDDRQKEQVAEWIKSGEIPNLLFYGEAGVGKTTLAKVLINELGIEPYDVLEINATRENGVDNMRTKIDAFTQTIPFGRWKIVLLDEADYLSRDAQAVLRNNMETYSASCRFILTGNYAHRIIPALKSRCHEVQINKTDRVEFTARAATVLVTENIEFDIDTLDGYVNSTYPDLRKCLNQLQVNSSSGTLLPLPKAISEENAELTEAAQLFKSGKINEGRQQVLQLLSLKPAALEEIYKWMYQNLDLWSKTNEERDAVIVVLRNSIAGLGTAAIPEIHLAATFAEISTI